MRKIVAGLFISLDGVVELPEKWSFKCLNDEVSKGIAAGTAQADAVLLGRRTYQQFAKIRPKPGQLCADGQLSEPLTQICDSAEIGFHGRA
jgi:dihydrofolate reductase